MRRSDINRLYEEASACFVQNGWHLPPNPRWDVTDFGLGDWERFGLVLINLAEEPEYCEKLMYARRGMATPAHCHRRKKEDIIARAGELAIQLWADHPDRSAGKLLRLKRNGRPIECASGDVLVLSPGERVTLVPGVYHEFAPRTACCVIGEVSTANDDAHDNYFVRQDIGRFPEVEEDEPALVRLVSDRPAL